MNERRQAVRSDSRQRRERVGATPGPVGASAEPLEPRLLMASIAGRHVFYNNSVYDGNNPAAGVNDDAAIAPGKVALLPGGTATFAHYTSYSKGLNGIMVDIAGLPADVTPGPGDFQLRVGNGPDVSAWTAAPQPAIDLRRTGGVNGAARVTLTWPDGVIRNKWLQVTVLPGSNTGLTAPDAFYFGNAAGETFNHATQFAVNSQDVTRTRNAQRRAAVPIGNLYDHNRDGRVNTQDVSIVRNNQRFTLQRITAPPAPVSQVTSIAVDFTASRNGDGQSPMGAGEVAGVVPQSNWNSTPRPADGQQAVSGTLPNLKNRQGQATAASLNYAAPNNYSNLYVESLSGDYRMMDGYLDPTGPANPAVVSFTNLPFGGTYDVYVYADGDSRENTRVGTYTLSGAASGNGSVSKGDPIQNRTEETPAPFVYDEGSDYYALRPAGGQAGDTKPVLPVGGGNYILFRGVSGSSFTLTASPDAQLTASAGGDLARAPVNGIQIVGTTVSPFAAAAPAGSVGVAGAPTGRMIAVDPLASRNDGQSDLHPSAVAGAPGVRQPHWNPLPVVQNLPYGNSRSYSGFEDYAGRSTPVVLNMFADSNFAVNFDENLSSDHRMMDGYYDTADYDGDLPTSFAFLDVPYAVYDVYVYCDGNNHAGQTDRWGVYTLSTTPQDMPAPVSVRKYDTPATENQQNATSSFVYDDATADGQGNFIVYRNVRGPRFTVTATPVKGVNARAAVNGIQIVEVSGAAASTGAGTASVTTAAPQARDAQRRTSPAVSRQGASVPVNALSSQPVGGAGDGRGRRATEELLGTGGGM